MGAPLMIQPETVIVQAKGMITADLDGEKAMMNMDKGKYYGLDGVGSRIWQFMSQPITYKELIAALVEEYDVDEATCQKDVEIYLNKLHREGLISLG